jgi:tRNA A-37 threonylcarbamoyl transferase component Bud32
MSVVQYWSSLEDAWAATERRPLTPIGDAVRAAPKADNSWKLIKSEARVRLILLDPEPPHARVIYKIYRIPAHLSWRSFAMVSRANREFTSLMESHRRGLPVVCPCSWLEARTLGCLNYSAISLELVQGINLEQALRDTDTGAEKRLQLARETGSLLNRLHSAGMYWGTAFPRNILLQQNEKPELLVIDTPYAHWHRKSLIGSDFALSDLRSMIRAKNGGWGFDLTEQKALFQEYSNNDPIAIAELQQLAVLRSRIQSKLERLKRRSLNVLLSSPRSPGKGGVYDVGDAAYLRRDKQFIGAG